MKTYVLIVLSSCAFLSSVFAVESGESSPGMSQNQEIQAEEGSPNVGTAGKAELASDPDVNIPVSQLALQLRAKRKEQLELLLEQWLQVLEQQIQNTSIYTFRIDSGELSEADKKLFIASERKSYELELEISKRVHVIIRSLEAKGGDVKEAKAYLKASSDITEDLDSTGRVQYVATFVGNWLKDPDGGIAFGKAFIGAVITIFGFWFLARLIKKLVKKSFERRNDGSRILRDFILRSITTVVMVIGLMVALSSIGVEVGPMVAALGAGGFILGFALQETLGNFASGMMIMIYQPFDEGDYVEIAGVGGKVEKMSLVSTTMLTLDNKELIIPNKKAWGDTIINYSGRKVRRVDLTFGISYSDDIDKALLILKEVANAHDMVLAEPIIQTGVHSLGDSSVNLLLRPWVKTADYWDVYWDLTKKVKQRFDAEGVSIPFPQRDLHVYHVNATPPEEVEG